MDHVRRRWASCVENSLALPGSCLEFALDGHRYYYGGLDLQLGDRWAGLDLGIQVLDLCFLLDEGRLPVASRIRYPVCQGEKIRICLGSDQRIYGLQIACLLK